MPCLLERQPWRELEEHLMKECTDSPCTTRHGRVMGVIISREQ